MFVYQLRFNNEIHFYYKMIMIMTLDDDRFEDDVMILATELLACAASWERPTDAEKCSSNLSLIYIAW